ncbi:MAG: hypothetical protein KY475_21065, partial [Planctomycetes bacterium]|nr:hypothetical protein [Planctomycetota bacterium]
MNNELRQSLRWIEDQLRDIQTLLASLVDHSAHASIVAPMKTPHGPEDLNDDSFEGATQRFHDEITR